MKIRTFIERFFDKFFRDETTSLAASLAFYTALSLAPLLVLFVSIAAQVSPELQQEFLLQVHSLVGPEAAVAVEMVIASAKLRPDLTSVASIFGVLTLLLSASLIFGELRTALNRIFGVKARTPKFSGFLGVVWHEVWNRFLHIGFALAFILSVIATLLISSFITAAFDSGAGSLISTMNIAISFVFYVIMFTFTFRYLPDRRQPWEMAFKGGTLTAFMFAIGKELIAAYLGGSALGSAYGAAGSIIVLLVWVYYSTLITFIGAQVSSWIGKSA